MLHICKWKANGELIYVYNIYPLLTFFLPWNIFHPFWNWNKNNYERDQNHKHVHAEIEYQDEQYSAVCFEWKDAVQITTSPPQRHPLAFPWESQKKDAQKDAEKKSKSHRIKAFGIAPNLKIYCFYDKRWICFWVTSKFHLSS